MRRPALSGQFEREVMDHDKVPSGARRAGWRFGAAALGLVICAPCLLYAASPNKGGPPPTISLTAYFSDYDSQNLPSDTASDGLGAYHDNVDGVQSFLTINGYNGLQYGDWKFNTYNSSTRSVAHSLDQDDAILPGDPHYTAPANPPYWGTADGGTGIQLQCTPLSRDLLTMAAGSSTTCGLLNDFYAPTGVGYGIQSAPEVNGFAETTDVQVTCNTADSGGCNDWFVDPIVPGQAVGRLVHRESVKHGTIQIDDGDFYLRFHIHLTRP